MTGLDAEHDRVVAVPSGKSAYSILLRSGGQRDRVTPVRRITHRVSCARFRAASETVALHVMTSKGLVVVVPPDILHNYARLDGFEWTAGPDAGELVGIAAFEIDAHGFVTRITSVYDSRQLAADTKAALVAASIAA